MKKNYRNFKWSFNQEHLLQFFRRETDIALYVDWGLKAYKEYEHL